MAGINFVRDRQKKLTATQRRDLQLMRIGLGILGVALVLSLVVTGVRLYYSLQLRQAQTESEGYRSQILGLETAEGNFVTLVHKLEAIASIMEDRSLRQEAISYFTTLFGPQIELNEIRTSNDQDGLSLSFTLTAPTIFLFQRVQEQLASEAVQAQYLALLTSDLSRDSDGSYSLEVRVQLKE